MDETAPTPLTAEQQAWLLALAWQVISATAAGQQAALPAPPEDAALRAPAAVFVTLWQQTPGADHALRGCIGRIEADLPLYQAVVKAAAGAAARDPRFPPLAPAELPSLAVEITLLSPLLPVAALEEVQIGRDGLVIEANGRRALLLPSVAPRLGWNRAELLQHLCAKAGLPPDTWPAAGALYRFTATTYQS
jgi:AmmeMemoRadiSam system protein A